jgi:carboxylesterase type B
MPFVDEQKHNATRWWGDVEETKRYCIATVRDVCARYGGDASRVVLMGFSRGAIACNYIGLHDDEMAKLWCGMVCHSHYEGEFKHPAADNDAWQERLKRLGSKSQFICQELSTQKTQDAIASTGIKGDFTFATLPFANHSARWTLCDLPLRTQAREWLMKLTSPATRK